MSKGKIITTDNNNETTTTIITTTVLLSLHVDHTFQKECLLQTTDQHKLTSICFVLVSLSLFIIQFLPSGFSCRTIRVFKRLQGGSFQAATALR
jgi:hypothetical protein